VTLCGNYLNRGLLILIVYFIPVAYAAAFYAEDIFIFIGQNPEVSHLASIQVLYSLPSVLAYGLFDVYRRWLAAMKVTFVPGILLLFAAFGHVFLCILFMSPEWAMDIKGLAAAASARDCALLFCIAVYARRSRKEVRLSVFLPNMEAFSGWGHYTKIALPSTAMLLAELYAYEIVTLIAGTMSVNDQAAQVIVQSFIYLLFVPPLGISEASSLILKRCINENNLSLAKRYFGMTAVINCVSVIVLCIVAFT
jgi:MATE family multidrug resistance protein